jgi:hypothetical protein
MWRSRSKAAWVVVGQDQGLGPLRRRFLGGFDVTMPSRSPYGDLSALLELTRVDRWDDPDPARLQRLDKRGFTKKRENERPGVTMKGRVALLLGRR